MAIRVELLNWRADKNHRSMTIQCSEHDGVQFSRVTTNRFESTTGHDKHQFISHTDLASITNTEYLCNDYLKVRLSVAIYSTPLLPLTPAWQDPSSAPSLGLSSPYQSIPNASSSTTFITVYHSPLPHRALHYASWCVPMVMIVVKAATCQLLFAS